TSSGGDAWAYVEAYGVRAWNNIENLINSGTITATATSEATSSEGDAWAYAKAYGVWAWGNIENLINSRTITATATAEATSSEGNAWAYAAGVYAWDNIVNLENSGTITATATATATSSEGYAWAEAYGVYTEGDIVNLENSGTIFSYAKAVGGIRANAYAYGIDGDINYLENSNLIHAKSHSIGSAEEFSGSHAIGVYAGEIRELKNDGTIKSEAIAEFNNPDADVLIESFGVKTVKLLDWIENNGTIESIVDGKGTSARNLNILAAPIYIYGFNDSYQLINKGTIKTTVKTDYINNQTTLEAYGIFASGRFEQSSLIPTINNEGTILVKVDTPSIQDTNAKIYMAGIRINNGYVNLKNTGSIILESTVPGIKAHSLWIGKEPDDLTNPTVTLIDKFAITFGTPGIEPSTDNQTNLNQRPIYVEGGTLNLNDAILVARGDSRNLKLNQKYYLIYKGEDGSVEDQWGGLERGYENTSINVSWAGEDYGENSAVMFTYEPAAGQTDTVISPVIGGTAGVQVTINNLIGMISFSSFSPFMIAQSESKPLLFASASLSDVSLRAPQYTKGIWFVPVYTKTKAGDLGFDANSYGFSLGFGAKISENLYGGIFAGYLRNNLDFKTRGAKDEEQNIYLGGVGLVYSPRPWYGRLLTYAYTADHEFIGRTGLNFDLTETADYKSRGYYAEVTSGYIFGDKIKFAPELGISYGYYKTKSFKTNVPLNPSFERVYEPESLDVIKAIAGFNIQGGTERTQLFGGVRIEQALNDNDISVINYIPNQPKYKLEKSLADTTLVLNAGLKYEISKRVNFEIGARADINGDYKAYTGRGMLKIAF
ncbi:MAG: autotransporter outer membrane beta-barrel domain-containing protein, partial [Thermodesulfovibrio sp.]